MSSDTDYRTLRDILLLNHPEGWAIEFGVFSGFSLDIIAKYMPVIGLDSFEGLPEDWREGFPKGTFAIPEDGPSIQDVLLMGPNRMVLVGEFKDTVPLLLKHGLPRLGLVHIDCDLYSSTVTALEAVLPFIGPGTYVVFDEYHGYPTSEHHEAKAWQEFCSRHMVFASTVAEGEQERAFVIQSIGSMGGSR
jgi:hypothetical protein